MDKIINGKRYNTNTATIVGEWDNGIYGGINSIEETLYRKRTGEFFLFGSGGANTKYSKYIGSNNWAGSEVIIPLSWEEAQEWAEKHLDTEHYVALFGEINENDDTRTTIALSLSNAAIEKARRAAAQAGTSLSAYIESLI